MEVEELMATIKIDETKDLWFVSDTHFNHQKLVRSCPDHFDQIRNYETTEEMNEDIMTQWNKFVGPEDTVIFLGDFGLNIKAKEIAKVFYEKMGQLNGNKFFIKGNHDHKLAKNTKDITWYDSLVFDYKGRHYVCQHYDFNQYKTPESLVLNEGYDYSPNVLVHGHTHSDAKISLVDFAPTWKMVQNCVCWEAWYRPVNYAELANISGNVHRPSAKTEDVLASK